MSDSKAKWAEEEGRDELDERLRDTDWDELGEAIDAVQGAIEPSSALRAWHVLEAARQLVARWKAKNVTTIEEALELQLAVEAYESGKPYVPASGETDTSQERATRYARRLEALTDIRASVGTILAALEQDCLKPKTRLTLARAMLERVYEELAE